MSRPEESGSRGTVDALAGVERLWRLRLPDAFRDLYSRSEHPFLAPCEFFSLKAIASGAGRSFGLLPQYLPFGVAVGDGGTFGFYVTPETEMGRWPILYWDDDEMFLRPAASDFDAFLRYCALVARYEMEDVGDDECDRESIAGQLGLPLDLMTGPPPRSDTELYERLACMDPQDAVSLCHLGCVWRARGNGERALDFYHRAGEAAPWFGDPAYLVADVYRERKNYERAVQGWWAVAQQLLPLCTRTWEWDLGADHPEADVYEVAADGLAQHERYANSDMKAEPLWSVVVHQDPYDPEVREALGDSLLTHGADRGAEREYLNALSLSFTIPGSQPERLYSALQTLYERMNRKRDAALAAFDRELPRPKI